MKGLRHPATVVALLALFLGLSGGAALASGLISGKQIKNHTIAEKKLTKSAIKALHGLRGARGPTGATGPIGPQGPKGDTGNIGPSNAFSTYAASVALGTSKATVASLTLAGGSYIVMGNMTVSNFVANENTSCYLDDTKLGLIDQSYTATSDITFVQTTLSLLAPLTTTGSTVTIDCSSADAHTQALYTYLTAIKLGSVTTS